MPLRAYPQWSVRNLIKPQTFADSIGKGAETCLRAHQGWYIARTQASFRFIDSGGSAISWMRSSICASVTSSSCASTLVPLCFGFCAVTAAASTTLRSIKLSSSRVSSCTLLEAAGGGEKNGGIVYSSDVSSSKSLDGESGRDGLWEMNLRLGRVMSWGEIDLCGRMCEVCGSSVRSVMQIESLDCVEGVVTEDPFCFCSKWLLVKCNDGTGINDWPETNPVTGRSHRENGSLPRCEKRQQINTYEQDRVSMKN